MEKENKIKLSADSEDVIVKTGERLSLAHCKKILNRDGMKYTDEEIILIRDFLYALATIDYLMFMNYLKLPPEKQEAIRKTEKKYLELKQNQNNYENSDSLHPCQHRRAG